jgi:hypothetical protein
MPSCTVRADAAHTANQTPARRRPRRSATVRSAECPTYSMAGRHGAGAVPAAGPGSGTRRHRDWPPTTYPQPVRSRSPARMDRWRLSRRPHRSVRFPHASGGGSLLGGAPGSNGNRLPCRSSSSTRTGRSSYPATCAASSSMIAAGRPPLAGPATTMMRSLDARAVPDPAADGCLG